MARERDPRVAKAFSAMRSIGIAPQNVRPVLKNLLKLYDGNWELIEEDNYRTLADAIFELDNDKKVEKNDVAELESLHKKPRTNTLESQGSSTLENGSRIIDPDCEIPKHSTVEKLAESSESISVNPRDEHNLPVVLQRDCGASLQYIFDIASSSCGQVKICFKYNQALGRPTLQSPNLEAVLRYAENKCMRSDKILSSNFSLVHIMKDLCDTYLELGSDSANTALLNNSPNGFPDQIIGSNNEPPKASKRGKDINKRVTNYSASSSPLNRDVVIQDKRRTVTTVPDITNGTETVRISLWSENGRQQKPSFVYIPGNIVYQSANVYVSLARIADEDCCTSCKGDCLSSSITCACARDTGGEFAYTQKGLLRREFLRACISMNTEPQKHYHFYCNDCPLERAKNGHRPEKCKGHLVKKFIKECWRKCRCNMECGNRVVQRGITRKLQVFSTDDSKGWGLRTLEELPEGAFVCEYVGEILTNMELYERNKQSSGKARHTYPVLLDADWGSERVLKDEEALCLDATYYGNVARFINHRCYDANLIDIPVEVETPDHHYYHIAFFTKRKVNALEELTWDYGIDFNDRHHPIKAFQCCCGSPYCRDNKGKKGKANVLS